MRRQDACDLALKKERVACSVGGEREGAVEPVRNLIGRVIIRIHRDRKKHELIVGVVGNRQPDRLDVVFRQILSEALPAFALAKGAGAYGYSGDRFSLCARDEACVGVRIRIEPQRAKEVCCRGGNANDKDRSKEFMQPLALHFSSCAGKPFISQGGRILRRHYRKRCRCSSPAPRAEKRQSSSSDNSFRITAAAPASSPEWRSSAAQIRYKSRLSMW